MNPDEHGEGYYVKDRGGPRAEVGNGAVVTSDVEPYAGVAGVPAERVRRRFPPETATRLEATEWWSWDHESLSERLTDFRCLDTSLSKYAPSIDVGECG